MRIKLIDFVRVHLSSSVHGTKMLDAHYKSVRFCACKQEHKTFYHFSGFMPVQYFHVFKRWLVSISCHHKGEREENVTSMLSQASDYKLTGSPSEQLGK